MVPVRIRGSHLTPLESLRVKPRVPGLHRLLGGMCAVTEGQLSNLSLGGTTGSEHSLEFWILVLAFPMCVSLAKSLKFSNTPAKLGYVIFTSKIVLRSQQDDIGKVLSPGPERSKFPVSRTCYDFIICSPHTFLQITETQVIRSLKMMFSPYATRNVSVGHFAGLENDSAKWTFWLMLFTGVGFEL